MTRPKSRPLIPEPASLVTHRSLLEERPLSKDEQRIVSFLRRAVKQCTAKANDKMTMPLMAAELHLKAIALSHLADAIVMGWHDEDHPNRVVDIDDRLEVLFGRVGG